MEKNCLRGRLLFAGGAVSSVGSIWIIFGSPKSQNVVGGVMNRPDRRGFSFSLLACVRALLKRRVMVSWSIMDSIVSMEERVEL